MFTFATSEWALLAIVMLFGTNHAKTQSFTIGRLPTSIAQVSPASMAHSSKRTIVSGWQYDESKARCEFDFLGGCKSQVALLPALTYIRSHRAVLQEVDLGSPCTHVSEQYSYTKRPSCSQLVFSCTPRMLPLRLVRHQKVHIYQARLISELTVTGKGPIDQPCHRLSSPSIDSIFPAFCIQLVPSNFVSPVAVPWFAG